MDWPTDMEASYGWISFESIDWEDKRFAVPSFAPFPFLEASLQQHGVLSPPSLARTGGDDAPLIIVDGFKRLGWAKNAGHEGMPCLIFDGATDSALLWLRRIEGKVLENPLNTAEKAQIVARLTDILSDDRIVERYLPVLHISGRYESLKRWLALASADPALLSMAATGAIHERAALELASWAEEDGEAAMDLLIALRCSASIQMEILEWTTEIARREGLTREKVLRSPNLQQVLEDTRKNHREKTQRVRDFLVSRRFPRLKAREGRFQEQRARLSLPKNIGIIPPPGFEGERWQLTIAFSCPEELHEALSRAKALLPGRTLESLMAGTKKVD